MIASRKAQNTKLLEIVLKMSLSFAGFHPGAWRNYILDLGTWPFHEFTFSWGVQINIRLWSSKELGVDSLVINCRGSTC